MSDLSPEQLDRIERNRREALLKRQQKQTQNGSVSSPAQQSLHQPSKISTYFSNNLTPTKQQTPLSTQSNSSPLSSPISNATVNSKQHGTQLEIESNETIPNTEMDVDINKKRKLATLGHDNQSVVSPTKASTTSKYFSSPSTSKYFSSPVKTPTQSSEPSKSVSKALFPPTAQSKLPQQQPAIRNFFKPKPKEEEEIDDGFALSDYVMELEEPIPDEDDDKPIISLVAQTKPPVTPKQPNLPTKQSKTPVVVVKKSDTKPLNYTPSNGDKVSATKSKYAQWRYKSNGTTDLQSVLPLFNPIPIERKTESKSDDLPKKRPKWLIDIRDENGKRPGEEGYDKTTLYIPPEVLSSSSKELSDAQKQYWRIKKNHFNRVLFFQQGTFYNVFDRDADILHSEFNLNYTHGGDTSIPMAGVTGKIYPEYAQTLCERGYQVGSVSQLSTDNGKNNKKANEIQREVDNFYTRGTLRFGNWIDKTARANYLLAIKEDIDTKFGVKRYGVCFMEASIGEFFVGEIEDDQYHAAIEAMLVQTKPIEIIYERGVIDKDVLNLLKGVVEAELISLTPVKDFWDAATGYEHIVRGNYFSSKDQIPAILHQYANSCAMSAVGACFSYLQKLNLAKDLVSPVFKPFELFGPKSRAMILDGVSLRNLEILDNISGKLDGTLLQLMDHCVTPFGKRLFRKWLSHPLRDVQMINQRLDAIDALNNHPTIQESIVTSLRKLRDLERMIARLHTGMVNLENFVETLQHFEQIYKMINEVGRKFAEEGVTAIKIQNIFRLGSSSGKREIAELYFPDLTTALSHFGNAFNKEESLSTKTIKPTPGVNEDFDRVSKEIDVVQSEMNQYLATLRSSTGITSIKFAGVDRAQYHIEIPKKDLGKTKLPKDLQEAKDLKNVKRYTSSVITKLEAHLAYLKDRYLMVSKNMLQFFVDQFNNDYTTLWKPAVECIAELDCLISLAKTSSNSGAGPMCRPVLVQQPRAYIKLEQVYHPCLANRTSQFIPNDIQMGGKEAPIILLTGPNMGGKSTMLRQVCIATIMAQVGCYAPAKSFELSPVDRIFTRIGANDNIMNNQSTFMVELHEAAQIIQGATSQSLVIIDELGRGTSTFDGYAIAYSVLSHFAEGKKPCMLFATHYHLLTNEFNDHPAISMYRMKLEEESMQPLYLIEKGACMKSYGTNVARLAGISEDIIYRATEMATHFEKYTISSITAGKGITSSFANVKKLEQFTKLMTASSADAVVNLWHELKTQ